MALQPRVDDDVSVVLVVVGDVEHEDDTPKRLRRAHPHTCDHVDGLAEVGIGRPLVWLGGWISGSDGCCELRRRGGEASPSSGDGGVRCVVCQIPGPDDYIL